MKRSYFFGITIILLLVLFVGGYFLFSKKGVSETANHHHELKPAMLIHTANRIISISYNGETLESTTFQNKRFMHTSTFDTKTKKLIAPTYSPGDNFAGFTEFNPDGKAIYHDVDDFGPVNVVAHNGYLLMDSIENSKN